MDMKKRIHLELRNRTPSDESLGPPVQLCQKLTIEFVPEDLDQG